MTLTEALTTSQVLAARGYDAAGACVVSVADYGGRLIWMEGWGGNWTNEWKEIPEDKKATLDGLDFRPTGPPPVTNPAEVREVFSYIDEVEEETDFDAEGSE